MPQATLFNYLKDIGDGSIGKESPDCSVTPVHQTSTTPLTGTPLSLLSTIDFFYPLVDDPYLQGRIACCNVLSDLYAMGAARCDNLLMVLGVSRKMTGPEREIVTREMMRGFNDTATAAGTKITGGQSVINEWPIIGEWRT